MENDKSTSPTSITRMKPYLLQQWDYEKNEKIGFDPKVINVKSLKEVHWICLICGNSYVHRVKGKHRDTDCDKCRDAYIKSRSISKTHAQIMEYWDIEKNNELGLDPFILKSNSSYKAYWKCNKGHESYLCAIDKKISRGTGCPKCRYKYISNIDYLRKEFDYEKNTISIDSITTGSDISIWWRCEKKHSYKVQPYHRVKEKTGCPYCSNKKVLKGYNSLFDTTPKLKAYWAEKENEEIGLDAYKVSNASKKVAYWVCENNHLTQKPIINMVQHPFCEVCKIESQSLKIATLCKIRNDNKLLNQLSDGFKKKYFKALKEYEAIIEKYWDFEKNKDNPYIWKIVGTKAYYWRCDQGHSWNEKVDALRTRLIKCRHCNESIKKKIEINDKEKKNIKYSNMIEKFWDFERNRDIDPYEVLMVSGPYYFKCDKNEMHKWEKDFIGMCNYAKCPFCEGTEFSIENSIGTKYPGVVKYWNTEKNQGKEAWEVLANNMRNYWWICEHGHEFVRTLGKMVISLESELIGCQYCRMKVTKYSLIL